RSVAACGAGAGAGVVAWANTVVGTMALAASANAMADDREFRQRIRVAFRMTTSLSRVDQWKTGLDRSNFAAVHGPGNPGVFGPPAGPRHRKALWIDPIAAQM